MLYEKYRPTNWDELVGQDRAVAQVKRILGAKSFDRGAFWIEASGENNSGVGKTSLAMLIARELADEFFITRLSGAKVDKATIRDMEQAAWLTTWSRDKPFRAWVIDESHAVTQGAVDALLPFLEALPRNCLVIFTTTRAVDSGLFGDDCGPFASRCHKIRLTNQGLAEAFAKRAQWIAQQEGLDGQPLERYLKLTRECKNNFRQLLQRIEAGEMVEG